MSRHWIIARSWPWPWPPPPDRAAQPMPRGYPYAKVLDILAAALNDMPKGIVAQFGKGQDPRDLMAAGPVVEFRMRARGVGDDAIRMDDPERLPDAKLALLKQAESHFGKAWVEAANCPEIAALLLPDD